MLDFKTALEAEHSKATTEQIVSEIGNSSERFEELLALITGDDELLSQRGFWVVSHCAEAHPELVRSYARPLLENLRREGLHDAVKRNTMKAVSLIDLPDELAGVATDIAFQYLCSPDEAVAIKVYSMSVLERICRREPGLREELKLVIREQSKFETKAAFRSRARSVMKALER